MINIIKYSFIFFLCFIINNCASIGLPGGGPADATSPFLILDNIKPIINTNINPKESIILPFNERLLPALLKTSIYIEPHTEIKIKNKANDLILMPKDVWPNQFSINISRELSDYNQNKLLSPIQLIYSKSDTIVGDTVIGTLFNFNNDKIYDIAIINSINDSIISRTQSNNNGEFQFLGYKYNQDDFILALEGKIRDNYKDAIRKIRYGISNSEIAIKQNNIYISNPINRESITSINLINDKYGKIQISNGEEYNLFLNDAYFKDLDLDNSNSYVFRDYNFKDSLFLEIKLYNNIEEYNVNKKLQLISIIDTIPPQFVNKNISCKDTIGYVSFKMSEPVILNNPFSSINLNDSTLIENIPFEYNTPFDISINDPINEYGKIYLNCANILDLNNNVLCDSSLVVEINNTCSIKDTSDTIIEKYGEINGEIIYEGKNNINVSIEKYINDSSQNTDLNIISINQIENIFKTSNLNPGEYKIWAYEDINSLNQYYFSGTLEPFKKSAKFVVFNQLVYVRANWKNSIKMELK